MLRPPWNVTGLATRDCVTRCSGRSLSRMTGAWTSLWPSPSRTRGNAVALEYDARRRGCLGPVRRLEADASREADGVRTAACWSRAAEDSLPRVLVWSRRLRLASWRPSVWVSFFFFPLYRSPLLGACPADPWACFAWILTLPVVTCCGPIRGDVAPPPLETASNSPARTHNLGSLA